MKKTLMITAHKITRAATQKYGTDYRATLSVVMKELHQVAKLAKQSKCDSIIVEESIILYSNQVFDSLVKETRINRAKMEWLEISTHIENRTVVNNNGSLKNHDFLIISVTNETTNLTQKFVINPTKYSQVDIENPVIAFQNLIETSYSYDVDKNYKTEYGKKYFESQYSLYYQDRYDKFCEQLSKVCDCSGSKYGGWSLCKVKYMFGNKNDGFVRI